MCPGVWYVLQIFAQLEADQRRKGQKKSSLTSPHPSSGKDKDKGFDEMNGVAARFVIFPS